jgi:hypothetical protein
LGMMRGEFEPAVPKEPALVHIEQGVQVPYTPEEQATRAATHIVKKAVYTKTMKVGNTLARCI